jgi:mono/diheme cytochrome c family protein
MRRLARIVIALLALGVAAAWWLTRPLTIAADDLPDHTPDAAAGERIFWLGGCSSCHATPVDGKRAKGEDKLLLGGGMELDTPYGVFRVPNISPDRDDGIGAWSMLDFVNAVQRGVLPDGRHLYPAFPYTSYARMATRDVMDLRAYLDTLPAIKGRVAPSTLRFPWSFRRGIGLWKRRYLETGPVVQFDAPSDAVQRGQALVEGAGHCGECHTPRDRFGGLILDRWLSGAPNLEGEGRVPNITPGGKEVSGWSAADIAYYLESGFTPDFDTVGGSMVAVQEGLAHLSDDDRAAIAAYLKAIPAVD